MLTAESVRDYVVVLTTFGCIFVTELDDLAGAGRTGHIDNMNGQRVHINTHLNRKRFKLIWLHTATVKHLSRLLRLLLLHIPEVLVNLSSSQIKLLRNMDQFSLGGQHTLSLGVELFECQPLGEILPLLLLVLVAVLAGSVLTLL